jgi:hypothetical protein
METPVFTLRDVPWQIWIVIVMLSLEGLGNLVDIPAMPISAFWLACKILFVLGFVRRWRVVYVLFCILAGLHVLAFAAEAPFVAFLNLVILVLALTQYRLYFPPRFTPADTTA